MFVDPDMLATTNLDILSGPVFVAALGVVAGVVSMLVYGRLSPQDRIQGLQQQLDALRTEMTAYDGDFAGAMTLTKQNLRLSLKRLGLALGPAVASGIPVLAALPLIGESYFTYFGSVAAAALFAKHRWKIA